MPGNIPSIAVQIQNYRKFVDEYLLHLKQELKKNPDDKLCQDKRNKVQELSDILYANGGYKGQQPGIRISRFYTLINQYEETLTTRRDTGFTKFLAFFKADKWFQEKFGVATTDGGNFVSKANKMKEDLQALAQADKLDKVETGKGQNFKP